MKKYLNWAGAVIITVIAFKAFQINKQKTRGSYKKNY